MKTKGYIETNPLLDIKCSHIHTCTWERHFSKYSVYFSLFTCSYLHVSKIEVLPYSITAVHILRSLFWSPNWAQQYCINLAQWVHFLLLWSGKTMAPWNCSCEQPHCPSARWYEKIWSSSVTELTGNSGDLEKDKSWCHFVHYKSHTEGPGC